MLKLDVRFNLLEQHFPDGSDNPFAITMMKHFNKLNTPLKTIQKYPTLQSQKSRFLNAGYKHVDVRNLWDLWSDSSFLGDSARSSLDKYEAFDEWEELALFASHYFLLKASTYGGEFRSLHSEPKLVAEDYPGSGGESPLRLVSNTPPKFDGHRRFGAMLSGGNRGTLGLHGGIGRQTRLGSTDAYSESELESSHSALGFPPQSCGARMCHTITDIDEQTCLLAGGRGSPTVGFSDCWVRRGGEWQRTRALPTPLFRHSASRVKPQGSENQVLIYGGRSDDGEISNKWLLWDKATGWRELETTDDLIPGRFGASLIAVDGESGVVFGGISKYGVLLEDFWSWKIVASENGKELKVLLYDRTEEVRSLTSLYDILGRFGASTEVTDGGVYVIGGIYKHGCIPRNYEIMTLHRHALWALINGEHQPDGPLLRPAVGLGTDFEGPRPLLVGHTSYGLSSGDVLIVGGGAVCFSFGINWNEGTWLLQKTKRKVSNDWHHVEVLPEGREKLHIEEPESQGRQTEVACIRRVKIGSYEEFRGIVDDAKPVILEGLNIGPCVTLWTKEYLKESVGEDRKVLIIGSNRGLSKQRR